MTDSVAHRGKDAFGYYTDHKTVAMGHRRLKIIDLSDNANQPMCVGGCYIVYNGEIYNYIELKDELKCLGHDFSTDSDTEVLLAAYIQWGSDCLNKLNGMFGFVIYDPQKGLVFAARDRFGIKPIYWWRTKTGATLFASEIKQFLVHPDWQATGNINTIKDFLSSGLVDHTEETLFKDVYQLRGGEAVLMPIDDVDVKKYKYRWYSLGAKEDSVLQNVESYDQCIVKFGELLEDSVKLRMRSDVTVGSCLSGGLDSSSIVCLSVKHTDPKNFNTFTLLANDLRYDERKYAKSVVEKTGSNAHYIDVDAAELFENIRKLVWYQDEPFTSTSMYGQWKVFKTAKKSGVPVILDGQGADEILLGYHYAFPVRFKNLVSSGKYLQLARELFLTRNIPNFSYVNILKTVVSYWLKRNKTDTTTTYKNIPSDFSSLKAYSKTLLEYTSLPALLHWEDRNSMCHTVESRLPFLDYRLVEFLYSLPDDYKLYDAITKRILRDAMKGELPEDVRMRMDKIGFATDEEIWFRENVDIFRKHYYSAVDESCGLLGGHDIDKFEKVASGEIPYDFSIWRVICFGVWKRLFCVNLRVLE